MRQVCVTLICVVVALPVLGSLLEMAQGPARPFASAVSAVEPTPAPPLVPVVDPISVDPTITLPPVVEGKPGSFIAVRAVTNGRNVIWFSKSDDLNVFPSGMLRDSASTVVTGTTGVYILGAYTALGDVPTEPSYTKIIIGTPAPTPPVVPPGPVVPPTPIVEGKRHFYYLYETADTSVDQGLLLTELRTGVVDKYVRDKGHKLDILDDELIDESWRKLIDGRKLPAFVIADEKGNSLNVIDAPATAAAILEAMKANGG